MRWMLVPLFLLTSFSLLPTPTLAADPEPTPYTLLAPIPIDESCNGKGDPNEVCQTTTAKFLPGLFKLMIAIASGLAVIMLIYAGVKYISTDAFGGKEEAKGIIEDALWGLLLAMSAWLILNTINPNLVYLNLSIDRIPTTIDTNSKKSAVGEGGLSAEEVRNQFDAENIDFDPTIILAGLRQGTIDEVVRLHNQCGCNVIVTSATGGTHREGEIDHGSGYKVDLRSRNDGEALTNFITSTYQEVRPRSNGDRVFQSPGGVPYVWETHRPPNAGSQWAPHWDVAVSGG